MTERFQQDLEGIAHGLEMSASQSWWYTLCTPQKKEEDENRSRGQYKEHLLSSIIGQPKKATNIQWIIVYNQLWHLACGKQQTTWTSDNNPKVSTQSITLSSTHTGTHAFTPHSYEKWVLWDWVTLS